MRWDREGGHWGPGWAMGLRAGGLPGEAKVQRRCDTWDLLGDCGQVTICPDVSVPGQASILMAARGSEGRPCSASDGESWVGGQESPAPWWPLDPEGCGCHWGAAPFPGLASFSARRCCSCLNCPRGGNSCSGRPCRPAGDGAAAPRPQQQLRRLRGLCGHRAPQPGTCVIRGCAVPSGDSL